MAYSPDHSLAPASAAPSGAPSAIPSDGPPWPNPLASIAYASCRPADCEPPAADSALTSRAAYERLNRAAARAETLVLYRLDMLAGCRDSLDVDQTRLEQSIQNLWRLTAVRKTLISIESALNAPTPKGSTPDPDLKAALAEVNRLLAEVAPASADSTLGARTSSSATAPADQPALASTEPPLPVVLSPSPSQSELALSSQSPSDTSIPSIGSIGSIPSIPPVVPSPARPSAPSSSVAPSPVLPLAPASSLAIGSVPACPRLSLSSAARTLDRVNADMANYTESVTTVADCDANLTAEEFLRPSAPKPSPAPISDAPTAFIAPDAKDAATILADPDLSPSLKSQISIRNPLNPDSCHLSPDSSIPHSAFHIPHLDRPPD